MNHVIDNSRRCEWFLDLLKIARSYDLELTKEKILASSVVASKYIEILPKIKEELSFGEGFCLIKGCPVGCKDIATQEKQAVKLQRSICQVSQLVLLGVTQSIGYQPFAYKQEKSGALVHEIIPEKTKLLTVSSSGRVEFKPHADGAYLKRDIRPHTLSLLCLNNESKTSTKVISVNELIKETSTHDLEILSSNSFIHYPPESFEYDKAQNEATSILDRLDGMWELKIATHNSRGCKEPAEEALERLRSTVENSGTLVNWEPGDLLVFNNLRCLHGRGEVSGKRWLQRCYGSRSQPLGSVIDLQNIAI